MCYTVLMSKALSEEEKKQRQLARDEKKLQKELNPELDERCYEILRILRDAPNHPDVKYNSKYFENHFKVANITILRAIKTLKDMDLLEEKQVHGSYVIKKEVEQIYSKKTRQNLALVAGLKGLLQQYKNTPLFDSVTKLIYFLEPKVAKDDTVLSSARVIVPPQIEYDVNLKNWDKVYEAIQKNRKINFRYTKSYTDTKALRIVRPYQLLLDNGSVYLFAYSEYADLVLLYDLNFMTDIVVTDEAFELPEKYDFSYYCGGGRLGAYKGNKIEKYKIKFTGYAKDWIKQHKWADDQKFTEDEDSTVITFSSSQYDKIFELILSWGTQAEPLAPKRLVIRWKKEISAMYKKINE